MSSRTLQQSMTANVTRCANRTQQQILCSQTNTRRPEGAAPLSTSASSSGWFSSLFSSSTQSEDRPQPPKEPTQQPATPSQPTEPSPKPKGMSKTEMAARDAAIFAALDEREGGGAGNEIVDGQFEKGMTKNTRANQYRVI